MASGRPLIAVADKQSELSRVVLEEDIGWVVAPSDIDELENSILTAFREKNTLQEIGKRARVVAEKKYSLKIANEKYHRLIEELVDT